LLELLEFLLRFAVHQLKGSQSKHWLAMDGLELQLNTGLHLG
jgi:hypothetical protein